MTLRVAHIVDRKLSKKPITLMREDGDTTSEIPLGHLVCRDSYDLVMESHRLPCPIIESGISGTVIGQYCAKFPEAAVYVSTPIFELELAEGAA